MPIEHAVEDQPMVLVPRALGLLRRQQRRDARPLRIRQLMTTHYPSRHSFRRGWASARKHLPDVDVAAVGGWKDTATMKRCYLHAEPVGVLRVVETAIRRSAG